MSIDEIKPWLATCGSCDAGLPMSCTCPPGDHRAVMARLVAEVELLQAEVDRERGKVGNLVREVEALRAELDMPTDITRGQLSSWPTAAFTAGPPLPRRVPMQAAFEVGEFPAIVQPAPMTDPALEDRTEGGES